MLAFTISSSSRHLRYCQLFGNQSSNPPRSDERYEYETALQWIDQSQNRQKVSIPVCDVDDEKNPRYTDDETEL